MKFVKFARSGVGVVTDKTPHHGGTSVEVHYHNGIKTTSTYIEQRALVEITAAEFEKAVRKRGQTSMLQYLDTTETEAIVWHTDPKDLPIVGKYCLVFITGDLGPESATFTGQNWRMNDDDYRHEANWIKAWAYEPIGPK